MKKNFLKILTVVLAVAMLCTQMVIPTFAENADYCSMCGEEAVRGALQHQIMPTCGVDGFDIYACDHEDCTGTITVRVPATGIHTGDGDEVPAVQPTCTKAGSKAYELCTGCGCYLEPGTADKLDSIVVDATGHSYSEDVTGPSCTEDGYTTYTCDVCGDTYVDDEVTCTGHDFTVFVPGTPATCKEAGHSDYYKCSVCDAEDPERAKEVLPVEDHNLRIVDHVDPTCTENGKNVFKCDEPTCPYYDSITEILVAPGHSIIKHEKKNATCTEVGYDAYETCENCTYTTYDPSAEVAALGHTTVSKGYVAPTCTETGCTDAIVCDRCKIVHNPGEVIPALGHNLISVSATPATCTETGISAHKQCSTCNKLFATTVENDDIDATPLASVIIDALNHDYETITIAPTCTEIGYIVKTCKRTNCNHTVSAPVAALGHTFIPVATVPAKCGIEGTKAHNKCSECDKLFAIDANPADITIREIAEADLVIEGLSHKPETVSFVNPTYNAAGNEAGSKCSLCGEPITNAAVLDELDESVKFYYVISGVNNSETAVNSGYVTLEIYFEVLADADDKEEYNSDVLANIFGVDFAMNFDAASFILTHVEVAPGVFAKAAFTPLTLANENGNVAISQDMVSDAKVFRGTNLFATLTFQVEADAVAQDYNFDCTNLLVVHPDEEETIDVSASEAQVAITVKKLGDANEDTIFTSNDTLAISNYIKNADMETAYVAEYDMNKDGIIDFMDLDLLRKAIVGNTEYLDIIVDPNENVTPEV